MVILLAIVSILLYNNCTRKAQRTTTNNSNIINVEKNTTVVRTAIDELTKESVVVAFVKQHNKLPHYYITKTEAREKGWIAADGNLCDVLPGKAIGGDVFTNREGSLPDKLGRKWYEADLNYNCGRRNAHRLLFSNDGLIFVTHDHFKTFQAQ